MTNIQLVLSAEELFASGVGDLFLTNLQFMSGTEGIFSRCRVLLGGFYCDGFFDSLPCYAPALLLLRNCFGLALTL